MTTPHNYTIGGVKVSFPAKAYPSQIAMMNKIISSLQRSQNCLLESPTGSGKSLALLCASLAWQTAEAAKVSEYNNAVEAGIIEPETVMINEDEMTEEEINEAADLRLARETASQQGGFLRFDDDDDDFQSPPNKRPKDDVTLPAPAALPNPLGTVQRKIHKKKVPKIYFGTRTHKQITQIIRELKKTVYKDVKMTILGSREHTCVHPSVSKMKKKNDGCRELMENKLHGGAGCSYQSNVKTKIPHHGALNAHRKTDEAWDLEDLVTVGRRVRACPYFTARDEIL